jgi:hypothetical protein
MEAVPPKIRKRIMSKMLLRRLADIADAASFILRKDYFDGRLLEMDVGLRI